MKRYFSSVKVAAEGSILSLVLLHTPLALSATFRYNTSVTDTLFTENPTTVNGISYDGTFVNFIFNPFTMSFNRFFGFFAVEQGMLGESLSLRAVQTSPVDRTSLGESGIAQIEYFDQVQDVTTVPGALIIPPNLRQFDFKFIPATVANQPTVVTQGWTVSRVPESDFLLAFGFLATGLFLGQKKV